MASPVRLGPALIAAVFGALVLLPERTTPRGEPGAKPIVHLELDGPSGSRLARTEQEGTLGLEPGSDVPRESDALVFSDDVPGAFIYDPLSGRSRRNAASLAVRPEGRRGIFAEADLSRSSSGDGGPGGGSFTLECFARPDESPEKNDAALVVLAPGAADGAKESRGARAALRTRFLRRWNQHYLGASFRSPSGKSETWDAGYYLGSGRIRKGKGGWRHLALVYDRENERFTFYLDHFQTAAVPAAADFHLRDARLRLGGEPGAEGFAVKIDEVRLTPRALGPESFLRARRDAISGVRFTTEATLLPADSGYVDLKTGFGAAGDGKTDDTEAFRQAFEALANKQPLRNYTLYVPPGTYRITDTIRWTRFLEVQGAGAERTTIRLDDAAEGYGDPDRPKAVVGMGWTEWGEWGRGTGNVIGNYLWDLTIDTGKENPGAVALDQQANNHGSVENVTIRSGDGKGLIGLSCVRPWPGPSLVKGVRIVGFDYGVRIRHQEYSMTFEDVTLECQNVAGIENRGNILALRRITSRNRVPAIVSRGGNSMVTLLESELAGGAPDAWAIVSEGALYARDVRTSGYRGALRQRVEIREGRKHKGWKEREVEAATIEEFVSGEIVCPRGDARGSLALPVEDAPEIPWGDPQEWSNVRLFEDRRKGDDWSPALQAAIDSGARTIYLPPGGYEVEEPVYLRGKVRRLIGIGASIRRGSGEEPAVIFEQPDRDAVVAIERLSVSPFLHDSPATLVLRHGELTPYRNGPGAGKLFIEDSVSSGWRFEHPQKVWARQWNLESDGEEPSIVSRGATIWALGFKTEGNAVKLEASDGARTEILGAFIYPHKSIPDRRPVFINRDSRLAAVYGLSIYQHNHAVQIRDIEGGEALEIGNDRLQWSGSRARMDLYVSHPER